MTAQAQSFETIFQSNFDYMLSSLRRLGVHDADLKDVAHEVFVIVYRKLGDFDATRPLRPWLFGIAARKASDYRKLARHRREVSDDSPDAESSVASPERMAEVREAQALVLHALEKVGEGAREVFILYEIDGVPMQEVADTLQIPVNTAYTRLRTARAEFAVAARRLQGAPREKGGAL